MLTCCIIEDDVSSTEILIDYIETSKILDLVMVESDPRKALEYFNYEKAPDITFLDIQLPYISGLSIARVIKNKTKIVFSSGYSEYGVQAFDVGAIDYLKKPYTYDRFLEAIIKAENNVKFDRLKVSPRHFFIPIKQNKRTVQKKINIEEIMSIQGMGNYLSIHTASNRKYTCYGKLTDFQSIVPNVLVRVHKSHIVNLSYIEVIDGNKIILKNGTLIPIGEIYRNNIY